MDLVTYPRLPLSTKIFNLTEYIPRTWRETIRSVFKFNYWFKLSLNPRASSASTLLEWKGGDREKRTRKAPLSALPLIKILHLCTAFDEIERQWCRLQDCQPSAASCTRPYLLKYPSTPQCGALFLSRCALSQTHSNTYTPPHPQNTHTHTFTGSEGCVWVWLSAASLCSHHCGFLWIHSKFSITGTTSSTFLTLLLRNISGGRIYFLGVPTS